MQHYSDHLHFFLKPEAREIFLRITIWRVCLEFHFRPANPAFSQLAHLLSTAAGGYLMTFKVGLRGSTSSYFENTIISFETTIRVRLYIHGRV